MFDNSESDDIDNLLRELDSDPEINPPKVKPKDEEQIQKLSLKAVSRDEFKDVDQGTKSKSQADTGLTSTGIGKSVRFTSQDVMNSSSVIPKKTSSLLNSMFFSEEGNSKQDTTTAANNENQNKSKSAPIKEDAFLNNKYISHQLKNDEDWLGLGFDDNKDTIPSFDKEKNKMFNPLDPKRSTNESNKELDNFPSEEFSLRWTSGDTKEQSNKPLQYEGKPQDNSSKPPIIPKTNRIKKTLGDPTSPILSRSPSFEALNVPSLKKFNTLENEKSKSSIDGIFQYSNNDSKVIPPITTSNTGQGNPDIPTSILDALPFLRNKGSSSVSQPQPIAGNLEEGTTEAMIASDDQPKIVRKKGISKASVNPSQQIVHTLQLPSHLVNEDELKAMSTSLKTLYMNQLEMQENSYKEQLDFFAAASKRKEELLKDELDRMQTDYDQRMQRLRDELSLNEPKLPQKLEHDISILSDKLERVVSQLDVVKNTIDIASTKTQNESSSVDLDYKEIRTVLNEEIQRNWVNNYKQFETDFKSLQSSVQTFETKSLDQHSKTFEKLGKLDHIHLTQEELNRKHQEILKDCLSKVVSESITNFMEKDQHINRRNKDKMSVQVKELRKDLRRLYFELENKSDAVRKSQLTVELEQRNINQGLRDINTFLKVSHSKSNEFNDNHNHPNSAAIQIAAMQAVQTTVQNETELKLLRDERNALSQSIAQLNVERRKLADEKVEFERDKMELDRERKRVREMENKSKLKFQEAEDLKRQAEQIRQNENRLTSEAESKLQMLSTEKSKLKERLLEIEQSLMTKEQKLFLEKSELAQEREFMEKLRDQLLCPGCLKSTKLTTPLK